MKKGFSLCLLSVAFVGTACTQHQTVASNQRRTYRSTNYTQVGTHIPGNYRQYPDGDDLSQSELQRSQFQTLQQNGMSALDRPPAGTSR